MASEFPHEIFIHGPGDLGQSVSHHEPHDGYVANVKYIRADLAEQREAELAEALDAALSMIEHSLSGLPNPDTGSVYRKGIDDLALTPDGSMTLLKARAILAKHKAEGREGGNE